jgi:hypothetical protein
VKKPDMLVLIAIWEFISAFIAAIGIAAIFIFAFPVVADLFGLDRTGGLFGLSIASIILLLFIALTVTGGIGLLMGKEWGRVLSIVHAALILISVPVGTVIGILSIIYLNSDNVKAYFQSGRSGTVPPKAPTASF